MDLFTIILIGLHIAAFVYLVWLWFEISKTFKAKQKTISDFATALRKSADDTAKVLEKMRNGKN